MSVRNEIKAQIIRAGFTMQEVVDLLHDEYGWSDSVSNLSAKLQRESIRYKEVVELADVLVDGPFILAERNLPLQYRGSENQRVIDLKKTKEAGEIVLYRSEYEELEDCW